MSSSGFWEAFTHGRTHDLYGLLALDGVSIVRILQGHYLWLIPLLIATGVATDLVAHNFFHLFTGTGTGTGSGSGSDSGTNS